jgi:hypothetical protein
MISLVLLKQNNANNTESVFNFEIPGFKLLYFPIQMLLQIILVIRRLSFLITLAVNTFYFLFLIFFYLCINYRFYFLFIYLFLLVYIYNVLSSGALEKDFSVQQKCPPVCHVTLLHLWHIHTY